MASYYLNSVWYGQPLSANIVQDWTTSTFIGGCNQIDTTSTLSFGTDALKKLLEQEKQSVKIVENPEKNVKLPTFPHCNAYVVDESSTLVLEFAVAGYSKDRISVTASKSNVLQLKATKAEKKEGITPIQNGISNKEFDITLQFDAAYDLSKSAVELVDGLLKISIPKAEGHEVKKLL